MHQIGHFCPLFPPCLVHSSDPRSLGLTLLWLNWLLTASADQGEHPKTRGSVKIADLVGRKDGNILDSKDSNILMRDSSDISRDNTGAGPNINSNKIALSKYALYETFESTFAALNSFYKCYSLKIER